MCDQSRLDTVLACLRVLPGRVTDIGVRISRHEEASMQTHEEHERVPARGMSAVGAARSIEAGVLLTAAASILLFVSLFLTWYRAGLDAWTSFEAWDLVLAALCVVALVAVMGRLGFGAPRPASWLVGPSVAALVIMVFVTLDPPPAVAGADANGTGLWLALTASVLMAIGALLSVARFSVAISRVDGVVPRPATPAGPPEAGNAPPIARTGAGRARPAVFQSTPGDAGAAPPTDPTRRI
jgi:hypothetical protein